MSVERFLVIGTLKNAQRARALCMASDDVFGAKKIMLDPTEGRYGFFLSSTSQQGIFRAVERVTHELNL